MIEAMLLTGGQSAPGEMIFTTPGTYTVDVPLGVSRVAMVGVGAGANGIASRGGGGGALVYANNVDVANYNTLKITVGAAGVASVVQGLLTAAGGNNANGGVGSGGTGGGSGGSGGGYATGDTNAYGGGGGAAGRYTVPGGNGAVGSTRQEFWDYRYDWETIRRVTMSEVPAYLGWPYDYLHPGTFANLADIESSVSPGDYPDGSVVVIRTSIYAYYMQAIHTARYRMSAYVSVDPTGSIGMGRGGDSLNDGEGVDLFGSNATPANNGYGFGGGRNRPGGGGAVRIIWGEGRSFPSNAGQAESETVEVY